MKKEFIFILIFIFLSSLVLGAPTTAPPSAVDGSQDNLEKEVQEEQIYEDYLDESPPKPEKIIDELTPNVNIFKKTEPNTLDNLMDKLEHFSTKHEDTIDTMTPILIIANAIGALIIIFLIYIRFFRKKK
jgi:hypothetical protein|tara:strand:- start:652 stop:1041 length:390 start_codon:yes stop_codon:yes gene_type:complete